MDTEPVIRTVDKGEYKGVVNLCDPGGFNGISYNDVDLRNDTLTVKPRNTAEGCCVFLVEIIDSGIFEWRFRMDHIAGCSLTFGVWEINDEIDLHSATITNSFVKYRST